MAEGGVESQTLVRRALADAPALSLLCAIGAWLAMLVRKAALPSLHGQTDHNLLLKLGMWGEFGANLAAVAGVPALALGLHQYLFLPNPVLSLRRRMLAATFAALTIYVTLFATFLDRAHTTTQMVFFGLGAAHVLAVVLLMGSLAFAHSVADRALVLAIAVMCLFGLMGHVVELFSRTQLELARYSRWLHGLGEIGYLVALVASAVVLSHNDEDRHRSWVRFVTFLVLGACGSAFVLAELSLGADFAVILYHAQRLRLLLEASPLAYGLPLSVATATAVGALASSRSSHRQLAIGTLLLVSGGYLPQAPGQLLVLALGACLISRAVAARAAF